MSRFAGLTFHRSMYAASAFASNTIVRSLVASAFPLFTVQMYHSVSRIVSCLGYISRHVSSAWNQLGINTCCARRSGPRTNALPVLQVRPEDKEWQQIRSLYRALTFLLGRAMTNFRPQDLKIAKVLEQEAQAAAETGEKAV